jgi:hypothetical protein
MLVEVTKDFPSVQGFFLTFIRASLLPIITMSSTPSEAVIQRSDQILPMCSEPYRFDTEARIRDLQAMLLDDQFTLHRSNILCVLELYKTGILPKPPGTITMIRKGEIIEDIPRDGSHTRETPVWLEVCSSKSRSDHVQCLLGSQGVGLQLMQVAP